MPNLFVIAGCNGAGKTTASMTILPEILDCKEFINADSIAAGLSPFNPNDAAFEAGRIMLKRIRQMMAEQKDFAFETTLSTRSYVSILTEAKLRNYAIILVYFWLNEPALAQQRVAKRVMLGGHHIPEDIIERRYYRGLRNLFDHFLALCDDWFIYDNSDETVQLLADYTKEENTKVHNSIKFEQMKTYGKSFKA